MKGCYKFQDPWQAAILVLIWKWMSSLGNEWKVVGFFFLPGVRKDFKTLSVPQNSEANFSK